MNRIIEALTKKVGLSSNQLLKCVLLNTAIELFSYTDAPAYSSPEYLLYDWNMEDSDHLYSAAPDERQILEHAETWLPSLPSDHVNQSPSVDEGTACNLFEKELETMHLLIPETLCVQDKVNNTLDCYTLNNGVGSPESFYYLAFPVNFWLELPLALDMPATLAPLSPAEAHAAEMIYCYFGKESSFPNASIGLSSETKIQDAAINSRGVQTTEELQTAGRNKTLENSRRYSLPSASWLNDPEKDSILWDSFDLHLSRSPLTCAHTNILSGLEPKNKDFSSVEDLFMLLEEETDVLAQQDLESILYTEMYSHKNTTHHLGVQPTSSTPHVKDPSYFLQSKDKVNAVEKLKRKLFNEGK
ncbi:uncharacterized protein RB166_004382 [Leptodactylus fuscus]